MKNSYVYCFMLLCHFTFAQDCRPGTNQIDVRFGEYNTMLRTGGDLFWDGSNSRTGIIDAQNNIISLLFASGIWMGGKTDAGVYKFSGVTYRRQNDNYDFFPGPLDPMGESKENDCKNWDKIFSITESDVKVAIDIIYRGSSIPHTEKCDQIPTAVLSWPARGNPYFSNFYGFDLPNQELASFFDYDNNGLYDPCKGDLPSLSSENCDYANVYEVLASFPSQMHFNIFNDNGGIQRLSGGEALKMEVHTYFYTFDESEGEDMSFLKYKTFYKGEVPLDSFYFSLWTDPDLGCYADDYLGTASKEQLVFCYNEDVLDGNIDSFCVGGLSTFQNKLPMVGISYLQGIKTSTGQNTGLTSSIFLNSCGTGLPIPPCDPSGGDINFVKIQGLNNYYFDGNPANANDFTMCSQNLGFGDRRALLTTGGIPLLPGDTREIIMALTVAKNVVHPCPDSKYIIEVNNKAQKLYNNCWQTIEGPDAPSVAASGINRKILLKLNNDLPGHNNKNLSYEEKIDKFTSSSDNTYRFEGYKVYQVDKRDFDINHLGESGSMEILNFDLINGVDSVYNWETIIDQNGERKFVKILKAEGLNNGVPDEIEIDYDYLNQADIQTNKEYYYVILAYAFNNFENYNSTTKNGQDIQYVTSLNNARVTFVKTKFGDNDYTSRIKRISGQGNFNALEISPETRMKMLGNNFDETIEYLQGRGPFDITVFDSTLAIGRTFRIVINGPIDESSIVCAFVSDSTYYSVTDVATGESYQSMHPISSSFDEIFENFGIAISLFQPKEADQKNMDDNGYILEKLSYAGEDKAQWFGALGDQGYTSNNIAKILDPVEVKNEKHYIVPKITSGNFFPFYYSRYEAEGDIPFITATSQDVMPILTSEILRTVKLQDLNNVDIVFTSDKTKWSRCIVVETASSFYPNSEISTKFFEVKSNKSVDKEGQEETQTTGFSWFPGYAVDVETGQRLNIFFGENTALSKNNKSLKNPSIADDMLFNPSDEMIAESNFEHLDSFLMKYPVGGGHYIYVTRQEYDECSQLAVKLKKGSSALAKRDPLGSVTWAAIPVLNKDSELLSYSEGVIPNDLTINIRVNNTFFNKNNNVDLTKLRFCNHDGKNPVYEFDFVRTMNVQTPDRNQKWKFESFFSGFRVSNVEEDVEVEVYDLKGKLISNTMVQNEQLLEWNAYEHGINNNMLLVKITGRKSGELKGYKTVIMGRL